MPELPLSLIHIYMVENIIPVNGAKYSLIEKIDKDIHFKTCKILDPCLGTGHLLLEIFEILMKKYQEDSNQDIKAVSYTHLY